MRHDLFYILLLLPSFYCFALNITCPFFVIPSIILSLFFLYWASLCHLTHSFRFRFPQASKLIHTFNRCMHCATTITCPFPPLHRIAVHRTSFLNFLHHPRLSFLMVSYTTHGLGYKRFYIVYNFLEYVGPYGCYTSA